MLHQDSSVIDISFDFSPVVCAEGIESDILCQFVIDPVLFGIFHVWNTFGNRPAGADLFPFLLEFRVPVIFLVIDSLLRFVFRGFVIPDITVHRNMSIDHIMRQQEKHKHDMLHRIAVIVISEFDNIVYDLGEVIDLESQSAAFAGTVVHIADILVRFGGISLRIRKFALGK